MPPVPTTQPAEVKDRVRVELTEFRRDQVEARGPGEITGPAVRVKVKITNTSGRPIELDRATIAITDGAKTPLSPVLTSTGAVAGSLAPSKSADGDYVFSIPADSKGPLSIIVIAAPGVPAAQFVGEPS